MNGQQPQSESSPQEAAGSAGSAGAPGAAGTLDALGTLGMAVEIDAIERELKKLWEEGGGVGGGGTTRASLVNFAVYCHGREEMARNTQLISRLMQNHACRAILIGVEPESKARGEQALVHAWINAHCHISREGAKQVCCEQISFLLEGDAASLIPNIVFSHLDSDLPLYLWWQGDFTEICNTAPDCHAGTAGSQGSCVCKAAVDFQAGCQSGCQSGSDLWPWVNRLFFDSRDFSDFRKQICYLKTCILTQPGSDRLVLCDLNWGRSLFLRQAIAQIFEAPGNLSHLNHLRKVAITHSPGCRTTAALLVGWLANQLQWGTASAREEGGYNFGGVDVEIIEQPQGTMRGAAGEVPSMLPALLACSFQCVDPATAQSASFQLTREEASPYWHARISLPGGCEYRHLYPAGEEDHLALLDEELMLGGKHLVYLKAHAAAESL